MVFEVLFVLSSEESWSTVLERAVVVLVVKILVEGKGNGELKAMSTALNFNYPLHIKWQIGQVVILRKIEVG